MTETQTYQYKTNHSVMLTRGNNRAGVYKYKYQGQERQDELGLNWDSFKWRNYDYAIGRFFNIDPLSEKYAYNSTYAFQENKMGLGRELEGLELVPRDTGWYYIDQTTPTSSIENPTPSPINHVGVMRANPNLTENGKVIFTASDVHLDNNGNYNDGYVGKGAVLEPITGNLDNPFKYELFDPTPSMSDSPNLPSNVSGNGDPKAVSAMGGIMELAKMTKQIIGLPEGIKAVNFSAAVGDAKYQAIKFGRATEVVDGYRGVNDYQYTGQSRNDLINYIYQGILPTDAQTRENVMNTGNTIMNQNGIPIQPQPTIEIKPIQN